jgi:hypothetical protein
MLKIKTIKKKITPEVGTLLAGYAANVSSKGIHDDLLISGIAFYDGKKKALLLSFDLLGIDEDLAYEIREKCATQNGIKKEEVILTCTHTHSGPHTRRNSLAELDRKYAKNLIKWSVDATKNAFKNMKEVSLFHYSAKCNEAINRRVIFPDNSCKTLPDFKHLEPLADGIIDPELAILYFVDQNEKPIATLSNYAAHPLCCQTGGTSSHMISSDYPGELRNYTEKELGGTCVFTSGACGDLHPKGFESGFARTKEMGENIGKKISVHFFDALRNQESFLEKTPEIKTHSEFIEVEFRENGGEEKSSLYKHKKKTKLEIQLLAIGDICFVGTPGEILVEPGLEIKWHSPFRKTIILYNSTAYISYIPHANAYLQEGYESETALLAPSASFEIVSAAIKGMNKLKKQS